MTETADDRRHLKFQCEVKLYYRPSEPGRMHLLLDDPLFTDENGERAGLHMVFTTNPESADFHPANYNRCVGRFEVAGHLAPPRVAEESRRLRDRKAVRRAHESH